MDRRYQIMKDFTPPDVHDSNRNQCVNLSILFPQYDDMMLSDSNSMYVQILQERNHTHGKELF